MVTANTASGGADAGNIESFDRSQVFDLMADVSGTQR